MDVRITLTVAAIAAGKRGELELVCTFLSLVATSLTRVPGVLRGLLFDAAGNAQFQAPCWNFHGLLVARRGRVVGWHGRGGVRRHHLDPL